MNYRKKTPCSMCPFRNDKGRLYVHPTTLRGMASGSFCCHKTGVLNDETGKIEPTEESEHCAGALIFLTAGSVARKANRFMKAERDPVGPMNDQYLAHVAGMAGLVLAAWGTHGAHAGRAIGVLTMLNMGTVRLKALGVNRDGSPLHPLYVPANREPQPYPPE